MPQPEDYLIVDTETTGLDPLTDEIIDIAVVDQSRRVLLNTRLRPTHKRQWSNTAIHGIQPDDLFNGPVTYPTLTEITPRLQELLAGRTVYAYGAKFDGGFLEPVLRPIGLMLTCLLLPFSRHMGQWDPKRNDYKFISLAKATAHIGYTWEGKAHSAVADALATQAVREYLHRLPATQKLFSEAQTLKEGFL